MSTIFISREVFQKLEGASNEKEHTFLNCIINPWRIQIDHSGAQGWRMSLDVRLEFPRQIIILEHLILHEIC